MKKLLTLTIAAVLSATTFAMDAPAMPDSENARVMNAISFDQYKGFWNTWKPITTRYRVDSNEIRVTYANDIAQKAMEQGLTRFPDGSAFGKISWAPAPDPLFPNSLQAKTMTRISLMVMDQAKYPNERGWGYAIFSPVGLRLPGTVKEMVAACAACHELAESRGYAFLGSMDPNQPTSIHHALRNAPNKQIPIFGEVDVHALSAAVGAIDSKMVNRSEIPAAVLRRLPQGTAQIARIGQTMSNAAFGGTVNELAPLTLNAAHATGLTAAFWSEDGRFISAAYRDQQSLECLLQGGKVKGLPYISLNVATNKDNLGNDNLILSERKVCK